MRDRLVTAARLIDEGRAVEAIRLLCDAGVPDTAEVCALLARAYALRGDERGDRHSARFFALRAKEHGSADPRMDALLQDSEPPATSQEITAGTNTTGSLRGLKDSRKPEPSRYRFNALSRACGAACEPKDFDWSARNVPCQAACPAATDIPEYLTAIFEGDYARAYAVNLRDNVFPGVLGRVCARPCEPACRHGWDGLGEPVAICHSKRAAADHRPQDLCVLPKLFAPSGKRVAVVGAGPAGLAAARQLALFGHTVVVFEKHVRAGGMMNQGIPVFRLPRDVIDREIAQIAALGVEIRCGVEVGRDVSLEALQAGYDAVVMAAGTLRPNLLDLPGHGLSGIRHGLDFLLEVNESGSADVGENVAVIGGGFTAMDCARTARRMGARTVELDVESEQDLVEHSILRMPDDRVRVWYRRSISEMLVTPGELEELENEGIPMEFMVNPIAYIGRQGRVTGMRFVRTRMGEPGPDGRRRPEPVEGSEFEIPVDTVLLATGQFPDTAWISGRLRPDLVGENGWLKSGKEARTAVPGIFVAGDFAQGAASLIQAIGHAKQAARDVDAYLMGSTRLTDRVEIADATDTGRIREMDAVPQQPMPAEPPNRRDATAEVETGYDRALATEETQRCYRCHYKFEIDADTCISCDWCIKVKPRPKCILRVRDLEYDNAGRITGWKEAARTQDAHLIWINQEDCIRCGACVAACPVDAISIQKVSLQTDVT
jgi:formate dehydrogenase major subunit